MSGPGSVRRIWWQRLGCLALLAGLTLAVFGDVLFTAKRVVLSYGGNDLFLQFIHWRKFGFEELRHGNLALWNPHLFSGAPFLGGFQAALLYPPNALFLFLPLDKAVNWSIALHVFLAGAFTYAWAARRGLSAPACLLAAVIFMFCGAHFLHIYAGHLPNLCAVIWAPLLFLAIDGLFESPSPGWSLLGMLAVAMQVLAGHPQYVWYTGLAAAIYSALMWFQAQKRKPFALGLAGMLAGGVGLSAVQLFTSLDEAREMLRSAGLPYAFAKWFSFPPENFLTLLAPNFFGDMQTVAYWGRCYLWEMSLFIGLSGLGLALVGAFGGDRRGRRLAVVMTVLLLLLALGGHTPLFNLLYRWVPGFNVFRGSSKFIALASLFLAMLSAGGFDKLRSGWRPARLVIGGAAALGLLLWVASVSVRQSGSVAPTHGWWHSVMLAVPSAEEGYLPRASYGSPAFVQQAGRIASTSLLIAGGTLLILALLLTLIRRHRVMVWCVWGLALAELLVFARKSVAHFDLARVANPYLAQLLEAHPGDYRIFNPENPNIALSLKAQDVWGYDPGVARRYAQFVALTQGVQPADLAVVVHPKGHPLLQMLRCRFAIAAESDGQLSAYEYTNYLPRLLLVQRYRLVKSWDETVSVLTNAAFNPREEVMLETRPEPEPVPTLDPGTVRLMGASSDWLDLEADVRSPSILLIPDTFAKGWRARALSGSVQSRYQVMPANWCLRAIPLAAGHHVLRAEYSPFGFRFGRWVSLVSLGVWLVWSGMCWRPGARRVQNDPLAQPDLTGERKGPGAGPAMEAVSALPKEKAGLDWGRSVVLVGLGVATLVVFWSVLSSEFVNFDDPVYVTGNSHVLQGFTWDSLAWAFTNLAEAGFWHPLTWLSHMLDAELYGVQPAGHHLTNLLLHLGSTWLLFEVLRLMTGALWRSAVVAALFALHPLHVESVAWVAERKDVLSTFFWMLTLWGYVRYVREASLQSPRARVWYVVAVGAFVCGLMSKTMVVTLPLVMLLLDYWPLKRCSNVRLSLPRLQARLARLAPGESPVSRVRSQLTPAVCLVTEKLPFLGLALMGGLLTIYAEKVAGALEAGNQIHATQRVANATLSSMRYLFQTVWPVDLAVFYPYPKSFSVWQVAGVGFLLVMMTAGAVWARRKRPYWTVGWFWYLVTLAPVCGLLQVGEHARADRYTYLPLIGVFIILAWGAGEALARWRVPKLAAGALVFLAVVGCGVVTRHQLQYWRDSGALFRRAATATRDNALAHNNLACWLKIQGQIEEAIESFHEAIRIKPDYADALNNLGLALDGKGLADEAIATYRQALRFRTNHTAALYNLGNVLTDLGRSAEAIPQYEAALRSKPDYPEAHNNLGLALLQSGRIEEAIAQFNEALRYSPNDVKALNNLGHALAGQRHYADAIAYYNWALEYEPDFLMAHVNLANALTELGRLDEAIAHYQLVLRSENAVAGVHDALGRALLSKGNLDSALQHYAEAVRLRPDNASAHNKFGIALGMKGMHEEAVAQFRAALQLQPENAEACANLGNTLALQGKVDEAIAQYEAALRLKPNDPESHNNLGCVLAVAGKLDEAVHHYEEALRWDARYAKAHNNLARALAQLGRRDEARAHLKEALRLAPNYGEARQQLNALESQPTK